MGDELTLQDRVRARLRDLVDERDIQQDTIGAFLGLSRSSVSRLLNDPDYGVMLEHIERLCEFFQITASELTAEPGALILPVSPLESDLLDRFRRMGEHERLALITVLDWRLKQQPIKKTRR